MASELVASEFVASELVASDFVASELVASELVADLLYPIDLTRLGCFFSIHVRFYSEENKYWR